MNELSQPRRSGVIANRMAIAAVHRRSGLRRRRPADRLSCMRSQPRPTAFLAAALALSFSPAAASPTRPWRRCSTRWSAAYGGRAALEQRAW